MKQTYLAHSKRHFYQRPREKQAPRFGRTSFLGDPRDSSERKARQGRIQYGHCGQKLARPCPEEWKKRKKTCLPVRGDASRLDATIGSRRHPHAAPPTCSETGAPWTTLGGEFQTCLDFLVNYYESRCSS